MKVLRILRRRKIKLSFILILLVFFIFNTYAWMRTDRNTESGSLVLNVDDWSVAFIINEQEITTEEYTFEIPEFYPGITSGTETIEKQIDVYNIGEAASNLKFEITEIYLYGEQIILENRQETEGQETATEEGTTEEGAAEGTEQGTEEGTGESAEEEILVPETISAETPDANGNTTANLFGNSAATIFDKENENYTFYLEYPTPFTISYTYGQTYITGQNEEETSKSYMTINLAWNDVEENNEEDTRLGNMVYAFENAKDADGNLINEGEPALRIVTKVTATREFK